VDCFPQAQRTPLFGDQATPNAVIAKSYGQDIIHLGCHGRFDPKFPSQSGLFLSGGWLTVQRVITELKLDKTRLFTMGACVSARADLDAGDELVGLTQAAFAAGTQTVASSLWYVDDAATRELLTAFYANVACGLVPVQAMRQAALTLHTQISWENPYFWAPFIISGLGHIGGQIAS
jgi:CHAT domain-containing protein